MRKIILLYGFLMAGLIALLKYLEYRFWLRDLSFELFISLIAIFFMGLGGWVSVSIYNWQKSRKERPIKSPSMEETSPDPSEKLKDLGISPREFEVLELMAQGCSNQEIADRLFLSLHTIKTHNSNLFSKLDVKRRTQAVQKAKGLNIIP